MRKKTSTKSVVRSYLKPTTLLVLVGLFLLTPLLSIVISSVQPNKAYAANSDPDKDKNRRWLHAAKICFDKNDVIDTDDKVPGGSWSDMYKDIIREGDSGQTEKISIGFDLDSDNGVVSCMTAMKNGVVAAGLELNGVKADTLEKAEELMARHYTDIGSGTVVNGQDYDIKNGSNDRSNVLSGKMTEALATHQEPDMNLIVDRIAGKGGKKSLVDSCYGFSPDANPTGFDDGRDFKVDGLGSFLLKDNIDWKKKFTWIKPNDGVNSTSFAAIGNIDLGFYGTASVGSNWEDAKSDFFPIGSDIGETKGYLNDAIVDCGFVKVQKDRMFTNRDKWKVVDNKLQYDGAAAATGTDGAASATTAGGTGEDPDINCVIQLRNPFTWIACPLIEAAQEAVQTFDNAITRKLTIPTRLYFETGANDDAHKTANAFYSGWASVRTISLSLLVIAGLVMVISQAIGVGIFDAYTVKKVLPRIFVAVILTTLSWELMKIAIDLSNAAGHGVRYLIYQPFAGFEDAKLAANFASLLGFGATAALVGLTMLGMMSFAITALLAVIIGFGLIVFREMLVMMLVIFAPLAIACYILPNTQKAWKLWWDFFTKALLLFPIISGMIAMGRVFAIIATNGGQGDLMQQTVGFISYYGPYFMLPAAFRLAGGAIATISGVANDKSRGGFDRLKKYRQRKMAESGQKIKSGARWTGNPIGRAASRGLQTGSLIGKAGLNPARMRSKIGAARGVETQSQMKELMEKNEDIQAVLPDDDLMEATQFGRNRADIEERLIASGRHGTQGSAELARSVALVQRAQKAGSRDAVNSAMAIGRANTGTGYDTAADMHESIIQAAGGDRALEGALLSAARSGSERARRPDLAGTGHVDQARAMDRIRGTMGGDAATHAATRAAVNADMRQRSMRALGSHAVLSGRAPAVAQTVQQLGADFDAAMASGDIDQATELASQVTSLRGAMGSASPEVRQHVMGLLDHIGIDPSAINPDTGQAYSTDEQLGVILETGLAGRARRNGVPVAAPDAQNITQEVRTRAGAYDAGGGDRTPAQMRAAQLPPP